jgi:hypothetical protein
VGAPVVYFSVWMRKCIMNLPEEKKLERDKVRTKMWFRIGRGVSTKAILFYELVFFRILHRNILIGTPLAPVECVGLHLSQPSLALVWEQNIVIALRPDCAVLAGIGKFNDWEGNGWSILMRLKNVNFFSCLINLLKNTEFLSFNPHPPTYKYKNQWDCLWLVLFY